MERIRLNVGSRGSQWSRDVDGPRAPRRLKFAGGEARLARLFAAAAACFGGPTGGEAVFRLTADRGGRTFPAHLRGWRNW